MVYKYDHLYSRQNPGYSRGWLDGQITGSTQKIALLLRETALKPINRKSSIKDMRAHPLGYYNVQALHMRSLHPGETRFKSSGYLSFDKTGGHEDDGSGIAQFSLRSWTQTPIITGIYQFDPDNPAKSVPILRGFTVDLSRGIHINDHRLMVQRFAAANGLKTFWHKDSYKGVHLLLPVEEACWWWDGLYTNPNHPKWKRERGKELHAKYKYRIRYFRAMNLIDGSYQASFVYDGINDTWV